jgi:hypothetical protein
MGKRLVPATSVAPKKIVPAKRNAARMYTKQ